MIPNTIKHYVKLVAREKYRASYQETIRLKNLPRYIPTETDFLEHRLHIVDATTFLDGSDEIFNRRIYEFDASTNEPVIIDCGANIGLSVIYFKQLYPNSKIIAFEPDPEIYSVLKKNLQSFGFSNVTALNQAIWNAETMLQFKKEGGYSGRIAMTGDDQNLIEVKTARLKDFLQQDVEFLKVDIEGAETEVIKDCEEDLQRVKALFVEYHSHIREKQNLHDLLAIIHKSGFRYHIKEAYTAALPFKERIPMMGMDLQLNIFAFRE
jgi:FkbM family methyltransferase